MCIRDSGKTSVAESMIYLAKASERLGNIADGNTVLDYDSEEIKHGITVCNITKSFRCLCKIYPVSYTHLDVYKRQA